MQGPTRFVFVGREILEQYHAEWRAIDQRFPCLSEAPEGVPIEEHWSTLADLRAFARAELRESIRQAAIEAAKAAEESPDLDFNNIYPIAV